MKKNKSAILRECLAIYLVLSYFSIFNGSLFAEERDILIKQNISDIGQKETIIKVKIEDNKNLKNGIKLLNGHKYEQSVPYFEKYLLSNTNLFEQLLGLNAISFGGLSLQLGEGIKYFKNQIEKNSKDSRYFYYLGIFKIISLALDGEGSSYLEKSIETQHDVAKIHYMLGLAYLFEGKVILYEKECGVLKEKKDRILANRLENVLNDSSMLKAYLRDLKKQKSQNTK